ncbi:family 16 glycosylhydrolase [Methylobacterium sp. P1-11]|uniref:family 16 glycosylhydrolase n=1 Tax=Methylobacterium sp. P1-11 TaxID=2024616 RepID=UPI00156566E6|nr:family 16 glycosylhydrolase [Methylobacterium sp. P1-11]
MRQSPLFSSSTHASPNRRAMLALLAAGATAARIPAVDAATGSAPNDLPTYTVHDARIGPNGRTATVAIRRGGPSAYSCCLRFEIDGGASPQSGAFVFEYDVDEILIAVSLPNPGTDASIRIQPFVTYDFRPVIAKGAARIGRDALDPSPLAPGATARAWNAPKPRPVAKGWTRDFHSDLVTDFVCTATGLDRDGRPCFTNSLPSGRAQFTNAEVGLYSDPRLHGTAPLQMLDGRRLLVPERLPHPIVLTQGGHSKRCTHSTPLVSTEHNGRLGYGRFAYRFALLSMQQGCWPAGWQLCLPHYRWPNCEQDTVEISFNQPDPVSVLPYQTNWWGAAGTGGSKEGQFVDIERLLPNFRYDEPHTYWSEWTPERMAFGIDETLTFSVPNRFFLTNPADPGDPNRVFMMLQIALGGAGGNTEKGLYPMAPSKWAPGAPAMLVEHMAHYAMPV